jgi:hypothetical protein
MLGIDSEIHVDVDQVVDLLIIYSRNLEPQGPQIPEIWKHEGTEELSTESVDKPVDFLLWKMPGTSDNSYRGLQVMNI